MYRTSLRYAGSNRSFLLQVSVFRKPVVSVLSTGNEVWQDICLKIIAYNSVKNHFFFHSVHLVFTVHCSTKMRTKHLFQVYFETLRLNRYLPRIAYIFTNYLYSQPLTRIKCFGPILESYLRVRQYISIQCFEYTETYRLLSLVSPCSLDSEGGTMNKEH